MELHLKQNPRITAKDFQLVSAYVTQETGIKMPTSKMKLVENRLGKRLRVHHMYSFQQYVDFVFSAKGQDERKILLDSLTTNQTYFFREHKHFEFLETWLAKRRSGSLNIWSAACSCGDEPYTMAILMEELKEKQQFLGQYQILGTDISEEMLSKAQEGIYSASHISQTPAPLVRKYFEVQEEAFKKTYTLHEAIKRKVQFKKLNLFKDLDGKGEQFDVIFCRNVLIYFELDDQKKVVQNLLKYLKEDGILILGHCESMASKGIEINTIQPTIYQRKK